MGPASDSVPAAPWFLRSRARLFATLFLLLAIPLGGLALAVSTMAADRLEAEAAEQNRSEADLAAQALKAHLDWTARYVEAYAQRPSLVEASTRRDVAAARIRLRELVERGANFDRAFLTDPAGVEWSDWPEDPTVIGKSFAHRDWYRGVSRAGATYVSEVYRRAARPARSVVAAAAPVRASDGTVVAYLVGQQSLRDIARPIEHAHPEDVGAIRIVDARGHLVLEPASGEEDVRDVSAHPLLAPRAPVAPTSRRGPDLVTGEESLVAVAPVAPYGWVVVAGQPLTAVLAPIRTLTSWIAVATAALLVLLVALGFVWFDTVRRKHEAILRLEEAKDQIFGTIVHDLRNPLTAILGSLDLVRHKVGASDPDLADLLSRAQESGARLSSMTQTILDVGRMEDGQMALSREPCDLADLVRAKVREYEATIRTKGLSADVLLPKEPLLASVDGGVVSRVVENLVTNAIKHTPKGGLVTVSVEAVPGTDAVRIAVADTGEGIPRDQIPRLFTKYGRARGQAMATKADTGLGLVFCRMAVELHGGSISVDSAAGRGTTFTVVLPRRLPA